MVLRCLTAACLSWGFGLAVVFRVLPAMADLLITAFSSLGAAAEDGYRPPRGASEIRHPAMLPTRRYLAARPLPRQQDRRAS